MIRESGELNAHKPGNSENAGAVSTVMNGKRLGNVINAVNSIVDGRRLLLTRFPFVIGN